MKKLFEIESGNIFCGDALEVLKTLPDESVHCCVTSPPYWRMRDYGVKGQIGLEKTPEKYVSRIIKIFAEVRRILRTDGTFWVNLGDSYSSGGNAGLSTGTDVFYGHTKCRGDLAGRAKKAPPGYRPKEMVGIPWMVAFALRSNGWYLRQDIIWHKPNPMPESVKDRCTKAHEYLFLLSKSRKYYFDHLSIKEEAEIRFDERPFGKAGGNRHGDEGRKYKVPQGWETGPGPHSTFHKDGRSKKTRYSFSRKTATKGKPGAMDQHRPDREYIEYSGTRNKRSVWTVSTQPFPEAHFATFPEKLIEPCILAGCPPGGIVLDPFFGAGTTGVVAHRFDRKFIGIELSEKYCKEIAIPRIKKATAQKKLWN